MKTYKITITGKTTVIPIAPVDITKAKIRFISYKHGEEIRAYFEDESHVVIDGGSGEIEIEVWD